MMNFFKTLSVIVCLLAFSHSVYANLSNHQFIQQNWNEDDGLPVGDINGMVQDATGYIWLASLDGLIRFDGVEFTQYDTSNSGLTSNRFTTIRKTENDVLWLSSDEGELIRFVNSKATTMSKKDGMSHSRVVRVTPKGEANIAYGTLNGVVLIQGENIIGLPIDKISGDVKAIHWPKLESLWVATQSWLYHVKDPLGNIEVIKWKLTQETLTLITYEDHLWVGTNKGLYRFDGKSFDRKYPDVIDVPVNNLTTMLSNELLISSKKLWHLAYENLTIVSDLSHDFYLKSLFVVDDRQQTFYPGNKSLWVNGKIVAEFNSGISDLIQEKSGGILIATKKNGLYLLKHSSVKNIGLAEGIPSENLYPVFQTNDHSIIVAENDGGVFLLDNQGQYIKSIKESGRVNSINQVNNNIWLVGDSVCILNQNKECESYKLDFLEGGLEKHTPISLVFQDKTEQIWLAGRQGGMWLNQNNKWQRLTQSKNNWHVTTNIQTVLESSNGDIMFGTNGNGVIRMRNNQVIDDSSKWGLPSRFIRSLLMINNQQLLVGTQDRGLCRVDLIKKSSQCISKQNNLVSISIHHLHKDKQDRIWWSSNRGVYWQKLSALMDVFDGKLQKLPNGGRYDKNNGMRNSEANGRSYPAGFVDKHDQLWIPTQQGLAVFDTNLTEQIPPAEAIIQAVYLLGEKNDLGNHSISLEPENRSLQVKLSALSFYNPKNIEFRYRQTNDVPKTQNNWIELGHNRLVSFSQLPFGTHQFEFAARNTEGQWQESPATLKINIKPFWYEKRLVHFIGLLLLFVVITSYIRIRNKKLVQRALNLEQIVKDRTFELKQMGDKRTDFFANISHELRTPLTLILGPIDDAIVQQNPLQLTDLKLVHHSAQRMKRLVDQMLDLQKIDAEKLQLQQSQQHLLNFLNACIEPFQILAKNLGIVLFIDPQSVKNHSDIWVCIDVEQMEKVIGNLLSNAFKFSSKGNKIEIQLEIISKQIAIKVLDNGPGIQSGANQRIFNRFSQESSSKYTTYQGTGIGLALVKEIIQLHGGSVKAQNRDTGGACFTITLPIENKKQLKTSTTTELSLSENQLLETQYMGKQAHSEKYTNTKKLDNNATVLIVEDNKDLQNYIASHLKTNFILLFADDGEIGLKMAQTHMPDIIISDVMMPNMNGFEMAKALRQDVTTNFIPFLFLTAKITAQDELKGLMLGADDYISKPFSGNLLIARIQSILDSRKRLQKSLQQNQYFIKKLSETDNLKTKAINAIFKHISEPSFNVDALAKALFMSRSKLHRLLKAQYQISASDLIRQVRMQEAKKLLDQDMGTVSEICCAVGYTNLSSFSKLYKQTFGQSPTSN